ncbi:MAG: hypothetical protein GY832_11655 [Chloroflexi bacterium]|nr:hypothetical protein [Chloroflexota bacterium]
MKTFVARNAPLLEKDFNEWVSDPAITTMAAEVTNDRSANLVVVVFYKIMPPIVVKPKPVEEPISSVEEVPAVDEALKEIGVKECPHCNKMTVPTTVERGPYKGRAKCGACGKTWEVNND